MGQSHYYQGERDPDPMGPDGLNDMLWDHGFGCFFFSIGFIWKGFEKARGESWFGDESEIMAMAFFNSSVVNICWCNLVDITVSFYVLKLVKVCFVSTQIHPRSYLLRLDSSLLESGLECWSECRNAWHRTTLLWRLFVGEGEVKMQQNDKPTVTSPWKVKHLPPDNIT